MNPVIRRLNLFSRLSTEACRSIDDLAHKSVYRLEPRQDLVRQGDCTTTAFMLLDGWAARYKTLEDGRRQTTSFLLPGDVFDLNAYLLKQSDHSVEALTCSRLAELSSADFEELTDLHPSVTKGLLWQQLVLTAIEREWVVNMARRTGCERIAHMLCELFLRLKVVGLTDGHECEVPLTQRQIADASGLTTVHVNRMLQDLRRDGLLTLERKRLRIPDLERLQRFAVFDAAYLHLGDAPGASGTDMRKPH